jgi:hypothetical protein
MGVLYWLITQPLVRFAVSVAKYLHASPLRLGFVYQAEVLFIIMQSASVAS